MEVLESFIDVFESLMEVHESFADVTESLTEVHESFVDVTELLVDVLEWLMEVIKPFVYGNKPAGTKILTQTFERRFYSAKNIFYLFCFCSAN
jgi:hypothetical protein